MNWLGTIFLSMFASNALLSWGFGFRSGFKSGQYRQGRWIAWLLALNIIASLILWLSSRFILLPLGIASLIALVYALFVVPTLRAISRAFSVFPIIAPESALAGIDELSLSSLVFGISLIAMRGAGSLAECLLASIVSVLGWWAAVALLDAIEKRTEAGALPEAMKGAPAILLSAALMAMTMTLAGVALAQGVGK